MSWRKRLSQAAMIAALFVLATLSLDREAKAYDDRAEDLARFFERVCMSELPGFVAVPPKLDSIGFDVTETIPGVFEARSGRSLYNVYVTPSAGSGQFASCALSAPDVSAKELDLILEEMLDDLYADLVTAKPDQFGGVLYRVANDATDYVFTTSGDGRGAAVSIEVMPPSAR